MSKRLVGMVLALGLALSACTPPDHQYVSASGYGMYFALPVEWSAVPASQLQTAQSGWTDDAGQVFRQTLLWQGAWTAGGADADALFAAAAPKQPVVWAFVRSLISAEQSAISDTETALADMVIPATAIVDGGGTVRTSAVHVAGLSGIRQIATYAAGGRPQTVEVVSVLAPGKDRVLSVMARCTESCFARHAGAITDLFASLTFKESRA